MKKIPMRKCVVTNERFPKKELIRVVRTPENEVAVDVTGKKNGRGAYLKLDAAVIAKARKTRILERHLEIEIPDSIQSYGIDEKTFMDNLDKLVELAYDDQCTGANPAYPLMSEIKQIFLDAYEGKF